MGQENYLKLVVKLDNCSFVSLFIFFDLNQ